MSEAGRRIALLTLDANMLRDDEWAPFNYAIRRNVRAPRKPVLGIVVEAQLQSDTDKRYSWPVYATGLRARIRCPVCLLVLTFSEPVAKWAAQGIDLGGGNRFTPLVIGPSGVPTVTASAATFWSAERG